MKLLQYGAVYCQYAKQYILISLKPAYYRTIFIIFTNISKVKYCAMLYYAMLPSQCQILRSYLSYVNVSSGPNFIVIIIITTKVYWFSITTTITFSPAPTTATTKCIS